MAKRKPHTSLSADRLHEMPTSQLYCRMMGVHTWRRHYVAEQLIPDSAYTYMAFQCEHCTMVRIDALDRNFDIFYRRYLPPQGYRMKRNEVPVRRELRREFIDRDSKEHIQ